MLKKDQRNTSDCILVAELLLEETENDGRGHNGNGHGNDHSKKYIKLINVYLQPDKKLEIEERLLSTIHRYSRWSRKYK